jgi:hypothetical protein
MRLFKKKSPSAQKAPSAPPAAPAAAEETPSPAPTDEQMKSSRFSIRRPASPTADEAAPPDGYTNMDDTKSIELPQKQPSREVEQSGKDNQESKDEEDESVAVQVTELDLTWMGFMCLWIWCAIPCVVYLLLFTVSYICYIVSRHTNICSHLPLSLKFCQTNEQYNTN